MKQFIIILCLLLFATPLFGQTETANQAATDSLVRQLTETLNDYIDTQSMVGRYKVYPTTNTFTSLRLDTATGSVSALQIGVGTETTTMSYFITGAVDPKCDIVGRFELYPTNNRRNFILLDTIMGTAYQVQWSTKEEECGRWIMDRL